MPYIYYLVQFQEKQIKTLFDSNSKINTMSFSYIKKLSFKI